MINSILRRFRSAQFHTLHRRSRDAIERWQLQKLRALVAHAARHVPFYKELLARSRFDTDSLARLDDIARLPILTKDSFRAKHFDEYTDNSRPFSNHFGATSGTTGKPFVFVAGDNLTNFARFRFLLWNGGRLKDLQQARFVHIKATKQVPQKNKLNISAQELMSDSEAALAKVATFDPLIIESTPSLLNEFAKRLRLSTSASLIRPRYVVAFGEMLTPILRRMLEETMRAEVYDRYGIDEIGVIGVECARHDGFHLNAESVIVEIVDDAGAPLKSGERGKIIATDLSNYAMPFIRYETGDFGRLSREACPCGLYTPRLWVEGRYAANLIFGSRAINHSEFSFLLTDFSDAIVRYQVAKLGDAGMEVRIVAGAEFTDEQLLPISEKIRSFAGADLEVRLAVVADIPAASNGKMQVLVDESGAPDRAEVHLV